MDFLVKMRLNAQQSRLLFRVESRTPEKIPTGKVEKYQEENE